jgi:hypothetical protein
VIIKALYNLKNNNVYIIITATDKTIEKHWFTGVTMYINATPHTNTANTTNIP